MKTLTLKRSIGMLISLLFATVILSGCSKDDDNNPSLKVPNTAATSKSLSVAEQQGLIYMAEQQKLLQNIYECMYSNHDEIIFKKNAQSKKQQSLLLSAKIDKYGITNPLTDMVSGEFINPFIQQAYAEFRNGENLDLTDCILYSKAMEEAAIAELEALITEVEGNNDLLETYRKILENSQSNLEALFQGTKGLIHIAVWYDPTKIYGPVNKNLRNISKEYDPVKKF